MKKFTLEIPGGPKEVVVDLDNYQDNKRITILLKDPKGSICYKATVNIPTVLLEDDEVIIKNYGENEGILPFLVKNNIVVDTGKEVNAGFGLSNICRLNDRALWGTPPARLPRRLDFPDLPSEPDEPLDRDNMPFGVKEMFVVNGFNIVADSREDAVKIAAMIESLQEGNILDF